MSATQMRCSVQVRAHQVARRWHLDVDGVVTPPPPVRYLEQAEETARIAAAVSLDRAPASIEVELVINELPLEVQQEVRDLRDLSDASQAARMRWRDLARVLVASGMDATRTGMLMGISRQAVTLLVDRAAADPAPSGPAATGFALLDEVEPARTAMNAAMSPQAQEAFASRQRALAAALQNAGLTNRDAAYLMDVAKQRIAQLAPKGGARTKFAT